MLAARFDALSVTRPLDQNDSSHRIHFLPKTFRVQVVNIEELHCGGVSQQFV